MQLCGSVTGLTKVQHTKAATDGNKHQKNGTEAEVTLTGLSQVSRSQRPWFGRLSGQCRSASEILLVSPLPARKCIRKLHRKETV